jgi:hypothetical protein
MKNLRLATAYGTMKILEKGGELVQADLLGVSQEDLALATGKAPWVATDRQAVRRTLDALMFGVIDAQGLPRFELPSEYCAAIIAVFVDPCNYFAACSWISGHVSHEELVAGSRGKTPEGFEKVRPEKLFALVIQISERGDSVAKAYASATGAAIERLGLGV